MNTGIVIRGIHLQSGWRELGLWKHQIRAIETIEQYLASPRSGAALIRMPMGTGKTGVMAVLAQYSQRQTVLVVVPYAQLREQICSEISEVFWGKLAVTLSTTKPVVAFTPARMPAEIDTTANPSVLVCTYQTLEAIMRNDPAGYASIRDAVDLVLADEGHREPAPSWSVATRQLERPIVLFTATPYRNDYFEFQIDRNYVFRLPYQEAEDERYIRRVLFKEENISRSPDVFVDSLLKFYSESFISTKPSAIEFPRVIVRCETEAEIRHIASLIKSAGHSVVEIHDNFRDSDNDGQFRSVPKPEETNATFWVHQNKLIEGVDDPSFCLLAIYGGFKNTRALVQQIGRVIRNPMRLHSQVAQVFSIESDQQERRWETFLERVS